MERMRTAVYARPMALYLIVALLALSSFAGPAEAMLVPASQERAADLAMVQKTLESKVLQQRLMEYGLTPEETAARIGSLSDEQLHQLAANIDAVQAGGDVLGTLLVLALIAGLVVLIVLLLQGKIAVERR